MKRSGLLLPLVLAAVFSTAQVSADVIAFDNFDYANGSLVPNGGWTNHSGTTGDLQVVGGQAIIQHGIPSEDAHIAFTGVTGDIFYGLDFTVDASGDITGTDHEYFAHFKDSGFNFPARLDIVAPNSGGNYTVGIATDTSIADVTWASDLNFGETYRAVVRYDQDANIAELWINAMFSSDTFIQGDDKADPGDVITQFSLRQSDSDLNETVTVDNLVIGSTFDDVVVGVSPVPVPATIWLFGSGLVGLVGMARRMKA
jgi:hypothetical protein